MSRIEKAFTKFSNGNRRKVLSVYCTAGFPALDSTLPVMRALEQNGADMIELGMPYSDPLADGPVIQASGNQALTNGMTVSKLFEQLKDFREQISIPVLLMGYMNTVLQYGFESFCRSAEALGIDGLILPDLPEHEFETTYGPIIRKYGLDFIFLIAPETSDKRARRLDALSSGFIYAVSSSSTTGSDQDFSEVATYLQRLGALGLHNPVMVGFGIRDKPTFDRACLHASGAIIGTAYINAIKNESDISLATNIFLKGILI